MRVRLGVLCVVLASMLATGLATASQTQASQLDPGPNPYIIGGTTVSSAPWGVQVSSARGSFCSGSIIAPQWVLTAAHCLGGTMSVRVGDVRLGYGQRSQGRQTYQRGDTGLIRLDTPINTSYAPLAQSDPPVGAIVEIYGWGGTCRSGCGLAPILKMATVRVTRIDGGGSERRIRAVRVSGTAWHGDSGGPMFYQGRQIGTCTGEGGGELIYPSVPNVLNWIRQITGISRNAGTSAPVALAS
jgi:secreted trypsin-like serine protease